MTKIVITGASGNYGRLATDGLIAAGRADDMILITRSPDKLAERMRQGCTVRYGDFDKPETLADAVRGAGKMLLISGTRVGARVVQHQAAVDAAVAAGVRHIVYTSFIGIDDPANPAEVRHDHIETERLIKASGCGVDDAARRALCRCDDRDGGAGRHGVGAVDQQCGRRARGDGMARRLRGVRGRGADAARGMRGGPTTSPGRSFRALPTSPH